MRLRWTLSNHALNVLNTILIETSISAQKGKRILVHFLSK